MDLADSGFLRSNRIDADSRRITALEAALSVGAFHIQTEMMLQAVKVDPDSNDQDSQYSGSYIQVAYFLSGQTLRYDDNRFEGVRPRSSTKVWLLVARYSELDARDNELGSEAKNLSFGLNYYLNRQFKFMLNASRSELSGRNAIFADTGNAISFRAQYQF
jgi:phosphate-selective porin